MSVEVQEGAAVQQDMFPSDGGAQSQAPTPPAESGVSDVANDLGIDEDVAKMFADNDPQFRERLVAKPQEEGEADNKGGEDHSAGGETPGENSAAGDESKESEAKTDDKDSGQGADDEKLEFADDVIKGFKGDDFGKLSRASQEALADFYEEAKAKSERAAEYEAKIAKLMNDPVIKSRVDVIESGAPLPVGGLSPKEVQGIAAKLAADLGYDMEDPEESSTVMKLVETLKSGIYEVARDMANETIVAQDTARKQAEVAKQGNELLRGLSQFNKGLAVKETDLSKFYKYSNGKAAYNDAHPEIEAFKNGIGKISAWAGEMGIDYEKALKMGPEAFYAAAAAALKMPVAFNTKERDDKMVSNAVKQKLAPFLRTGGGTLDVGGGSAAQGGGGEAVIVHGFNAVRLVEDQAYLAEMYDRYLTDPDRLNQLDVAASIGRSIIEKQSKIRR
jgi:hypothetical protein